MPPSTKRYTLSGIKQTLFASLCVLIAHTHYAQTTTDFSDSTDLSQLLQLENTAELSVMEAAVNENLSVASKKPLSARKSPSVVSYISRDEIQKSGARDLVDVLRLVPGFEFVVDLANAVGIGIRGNSSIEGKVLILLDGMEMNERLYGTIQIGNHFPIDQIERIEIIRGAGSAIYGGYAQYGVINIITQSADMNGISASATYGQVKDSYARRNISVHGGKKFKDGGFTLGAFAGQGIRSNQTYIDIYGNSVSMLKGSQTDPFMLNGSINYAGFSFRGIMNHFRTNAISGYATVNSQAYPSDYISYFGELKYNKPITNKLSITPLLSYKKNIPWKTNTEIDSNDYYLPFYSQNEQYRANVTASYDFTNYINLIAGGEFFTDRAKRLLEDDVFSNNKSSISFYNYAAFTQLLVKSRIVNFTAGARYDNNTSFGSAFVPRLGIVKSWKKLNIKLLNSYAFRAPTIENVTYATDGNIKPEVTRIWEAEVGYQATRDIYLSCNVFDLKTRDVIIYSYANIDGEVVEGYENIASTGSQGIELEAKWKHKKAYIDAGYSFYTSQSVFGRSPLNLVETYRIPQINRQLLAFPAHKFTINGSYSFYKNYFFSPSVIVLGNRYGYTSVTYIEDEEGNTEEMPVVEKMPTLALVHLFMGCHDFLTKNLNVSVGCYNLLNSNYQFIQPYNGGHAPLPSLSREITVKLQYLLPFQQK